MIMKRRRKEGEREGKGEDKRSLHAPLFGHIPYACKKIVGGPFMKGKASSSHLPSPKFAGKYLRREEERGRLGDEDPSLFREEESNKSQTEEAGSSKGEIALNKKKGNFNGEEILFFLFTAFLLGDNEGIYLPPPANTFPEKEEEEEHAY